MFQKDSLKTSLSSVKKVSDSLDEEKINHVTSFQEDEEVDDDYIVEDSKEQLVQIEGRHGMYQASIGIID